MSEVNKNELANTEAAKNNEEATGMEEKKASKFVEVVKKVWNSKPVTVIKKVAVPLGAAAVGFVGGVMLSRNSDDADDSYDEYDEDDQVEE